MNKKKKFQMKSKHLLVLMTFLCISAILLTFTQVVSVAPLREAATRIIVPFQNGINQVGTLMSGKLDAVITDEMPAKAIAEQNSEELQVIDEKLTEEEYALGIAKDSDLLEVANEVIAKLKEEGKIDEFVLNHNMQQ